jgi:hypothetical protein
VAKIILLKNKFPDFFPVLQHGIQIVSEINANNTRMKASLTLFWCVQYDAIIFKVR